MLIKAKAKLYWEEYQGTYKLELHVKFKLPNQKFNRRRKKILENSWWVGDEYKDYDEFWSCVNEILNDRKQLEDEVKDVITWYIKDKFKLTEKDKNKEKVAKLIEAINKDFVVEFEYKESQ